MLASGLASTSQERTTLSSPTVAGPDMDEDAVTFGGSVKSESIYTKIIHMKSY